MIPFTFGRPGTIYGATYISVCLRGKIRALLYRNNIIPLFDNRWYLNVYANAGPYSPRIARVPLGMGDCPYARQAAARILPFFLVKQGP